MNFPHYSQHDAMDCGPTCLRMVAAFYGRIYSLENLRVKSLITREGTSMLGISEASESIGFRTTGVKVGFDDLKEAPMPCIVHWNQYHFVVVYDIKEKHGKEIVYISDPAARKLTYTREEFCHCWISTKDDGKDVGIALLLEPSPGFYEQEGEKINRKGFLFLFSYLRPYKNMVIQLFLGLLFGSLLQLILPFLTQSIVDFGISAQNIGYIYLVLIAQLVLTFSSSAVGFIRGWILLHLGTRINIALISDFLIKMMRLPMGYFDTKMTGDILQRINDHTRIQNYLTNSSLSILFSVFNLFIFSIVLLPKVSQEFKLNITGGLNFGQFINFLYFKDLTLHDLKKVKQQFLGHSLV